MANTQPVNFRADSLFYNQAKEILENKKITVSDVFNAVLRKVATGAVDVDEFVSSDLSDGQLTVAFEDLKKEILLGHQDIQEGRITSLRDVRKEFRID
ncbi:MAG: antitoxin [Streptococcus sp.]|nr:antitoxin [Streptococcus sp.]